MKKLAVVLLNWNGEGLLKRFLPVLLQHTPADLADIVVADNGSTDGSPAWLRGTYPQVQCLELKENFGFAGGYNRALAALPYPFWVLLNTDVEVQPGWLEPLLEYLEEHEEVAAVQPKLLSLHEREYFEYAGAAGGFIDRLGYPFCRGRLLQTLERDEGQYDETREVFWATGACLVIKRADFVEVGGFDEAFFAHQEEVDLCWRLGRRGRKLACVPQSAVYHLGAATLKKESPKKTYLNFRNNLLMLYKNLPAEELRRVLCLRLLLDGLAMLVFLLKGNAANAWAVLRAGRDFRRERKRYRAYRKEESALGLYDTRLPTLYAKSLLLGYYLQGKKHFSDL